MGQRRAHKVKKRNDRKKAAAAKRQRRAERPFYEELGRDGEIVTARVAGRRVKYHSALAALMISSASASQAGMSRIAPSEG